VSIYGLRNRVVCYVTGTTLRGTALLVFEHTEDDPSNPAGVQVPAGAMLPFESLRDAATREVAEETGVTSLTYVDQVGFAERGLADPDGAGVDNYAHLLATAADAAGTWEHRVTGDRVDAGMTFRCWWEPLPLTIPLADGQGAFLDRLGA
jgi:8-oxo-dGTP pyrophosphatase MutT (NUDIX family)